MSFSGTKGYITKPKPGVMLNPLHPLSRGLVGYWLFNEGSGSRAYDISGHSNHGRLTNMSSNAQGSGWGSSKFGGGLKFDGNNDYSEIPDNPSLNFGSSDFSCCMWVNGTPPGADALFIVTKYDNQISSAMWVLQLRSTGYLWGIIRDSNNDKAQAEGNIQVGDGLYHHIAMVRKGNTIYLYIDGVLDASDTNALVGSTDIATPLRIGTIHLNGNNTWHFNGIVDQICTYNHALPAKEIKTLYNSPFCNLLQVPIKRYSVAAPPIGAIMNQFQMNNLGADLYQGAIIA